MMLSNFGTEGFTEIQFDRPDKTRIVARLLAHTHAFYIYLCTTIMHTHKHSHTYTYALPLLYVFVGHMKT